MSLWYECDRCKGKFCSDWSDEEAQLEALFEFGVVSEDKQQVVCDDCYAVLMGRVSQ